MPWSDSPLRTLTLPQDAASSDPRIVIGPDIPAALAAHGAPNTTWSAAILWYFNATDFYFIAVGHQVVPGPFPDYDFVAKGTYREPPLEGVTVHELLSTDGIPGNYYGDPVEFLTFSYQNCMLKIYDSTIRMGGIGLEIGKNAIKAGDPTSVVDGVEAWHAPVMQNGWTSSPAVPIVYRLVPSPARSVQIVGIATPGVKANGTVLFTLPSQYWPAVRDVFTIVGAATNALTGGFTPMLHLDLNGDVACFGLIAASGDLFINMLIPLDMP